MSNRSWDARITSRVLVGEIVDVPLVLDGTPDAGEIQVHEAEEEPPRLAVFRSG